MELNQNTKISKTYQFQHKKLVEKNAVVRGGRSGDPSRFRPAGSSHNCQTRGRYQRTGPPTGTDGDACGSAPREYSPEVSPYCTAMDLEDLSDDAKHLIYIEISNKQANLHNNIDSTIRRNYPTPYEEEQEKRKENTNTPKQPNQTNTTHTHNTHKHTHTTHTNTYNTHHTNTANQSQRNRKPSEAWRVRRGFYPAETKA